MTTFASSGIDGTRPDLGGQSVPPSDDAMVVDSGINGLSAQHNAIPEFAPSPTDADVEPSNATMKFSNPGHPISSDQGLGAEPEPTSSAHPIATVDSSVAVEDNVASSDVPSEPLAASADIATSVTKPMEDAGNVTAPEEPVAPSATDLTSGAPSNSTGEAKASTNEPSLGSLPDNTGAIIDTEMGADLGQANGVTDVTNPTISSPPTTQLESANLESQQPSPTDQPAQADVDQEMTDSMAPPKIAREREDDEETLEPAAKRPKTDASPPQDGESIMEAPASSTEPTSETPQSAPGATTNGVREEPTARTQDHGPMTDLRAKRLIEGIKNVKKGKHATAFARPVDPAALNLPKYFEIIKHPMDLSTMEQKLKDNQYSTVNEYVADFDQMVQNAITFNGQSHPVSQAGMSIKAQLNAQLKRLPPPGDSAPPAASKKKRNSLPDATRETKRRDSQRQSLGNAQTPGTPHAPGPDGVPIIRRDSAVGDRPKRKLVKPAPRDLAYAKPQKKKFRAELRFAEEVLTEMKRGRYSVFSAPFQHPVDPVALNIPDYHKVIKSPMDVSTIAEKMSSNQYENLKEFETDFRQIFKNCYKFNPNGTAVNTMGKQYEEVFNAEMTKKNEKIAAYAPPSAAASPTADSDDSEEEDEEEEIDEEDRAAKIKDLTDQLQEFTQKIQSLSAGMPIKSGKATNKKGKSKGKSAPTKTAKRASVAAPIVAKVAKKEKPKTKVKPKKPLTNAQKEEIANRIGELPTEEISRVADKIKASLAAEGKPVPSDDELEFQIDDIPEDLLQELYLKVRKLATPSQVTKDEDSDLYESSPPARQPAKPKKNRPMNKREQEEQISRLQSQLATFQPAPATEALFQDPKQESSDESGSESEEE